MRWRSAAYLQLFDNDIEQTHVIYVTLGHVDFEPSAN